MPEMFQRVLLKLEYSTKLTRNIHRPWGKTKSIKDLIEKETFITVYEKNKKQRKEKRNSLTNKQKTAIP